MAGVAKQMQTNANKKKEDVKEEPPIVSKVKEEPATSSKVKQEFVVSQGEKTPVTRGSTNSSRGGKVPAKGSRCSMRNSAAAAVENIKAGNIQLGHKPQVSCARLTVYTGKECDQKIYESQDEISVDNQKTEVPVEQPAEQPRCMMTSTEHYKHPQTAKCGRVEAPMSRLDTPCVLSNSKVDDTERRSTEIVEEQSYITNIIPDAEIQTSETDYKDWLAAHGLLELKSSPGKDDILEAKYRERKAALNNLHWSLDAIYKFIDINEFTQIEHEEIENKLQEIIDSLKLKLVHGDPVFCKIEERGKIKRTV